MRSPTLAVDDPYGFWRQACAQPAHGIAQVLAEHLSELPVAREEIQAEQLALPIAQRPIGDMCPECGEATLLNVGELPQMSGLRL